MTDTDTAGLDGEAFREVVGHFASGVTIITSRRDGEPLGATASAFTSLSLEPPMVVVCLNRESRTGQAAVESGELAVNILGEDHAELAMRFAGDGDDKFAGVAIDGDEDRPPRLRGALASLLCRVSEHMRAATHVVFLAEVLEAKAGSGAPLAYYRGRFGRLEMEEDRDLLRQVRSRLLDGTLGEGGSERLTAAEVARALGAGEGPTYHALSRLAADGLLERSGSAFLARDATDVMLDDLLVARRAIELSVARDTVGRVEPERLQQLRRQMEATVGLIDPAGNFVDIERWVAANGEFHEAMVALAGSEALLDAYRGLGLGGVDTRRLPREGAMPGLADDHRVLVEAYEAGDIEAACTTIERHLRRAAEARGE